MRKIFTGFASRAASLALVLLDSGAVLLAAKTAVPALCVPRVTVCMLAALSLASLVLARAFTGGEERTLADAAAATALAALFFGGAAWACGLADAFSAVRAAVAGGAVYAACLLAFTGAERRARGAAHPLAPLASFAFLAFLAAQIFAGMAVI